MNEFIYFTSILESLSKNAYVRRTSTGSGLVVFLGSDFAHIFRQIVSIRVKTLSKTNMVASRYMNRKESSLPVDLRHPKTSLLKLPFNHFEIVRGTGTVFYVEVHYGIVLETLLPILLAGAKLKQG